MLPWLDSATWGDLPADSLHVTAMRLGLAAVLGVVVAAIYYTAQRRPAAEVFPFLVTLSLLTILVAMTTRVIGDNVARAFGLVGALSIVRFRTVVEDTRDTAFVIFAVAVGMAAGAGFPDVWLVGVPVVTVVAVGLSRLGQSFKTSAANTAGSESTLELRLAAALDPNKTVADVFARHVSSSRLKSAVTARQGAALDVTYFVKIARTDGQLALVRELGQIEGVQNVELKVG